MNEEKLIEEVNQRICNILNPVKDIITSEMDRGVHTYDNDQDAIDFCINYSHKVSSTIASNLLTTSMKMVLFLEGRSEMDEPTKERLDHLKEEYIKSITLKIEEAYEKKIQEFNK